MALHINLYHEIQKQALVRRRDPLKLGMFGLLIIGVGLVAYYFVRVEQIASLNTRVATLEQEYKKYEPKQKAAKAREDELNENIKVSELLVKRIEGRFYWAPILGRILQNTPTAVQFTKLNGVLATEPFQPASLVMTGIAGSEVPRKTAEDLRTTLAEKIAPDFKKVEAGFSSLEDSDVNVTVAGQSRPVANFIIDIHLKKTEPAPTPVPARKKVAVAAQ
ncbi:MAG: hypothetical protein QOD99_1478 [Chthoniobacter sp.]|jgi:Tfp pilus assembly protein PilN|nr:hypothetical protein [Chthoniobacter sp.]